MAVPFYISISNVLKVAITLVIVCVFDYSYSSKCEAFDFGFDLPFPNNQWHWDYSVCRYSIHIVLMEGLFKYFCPFKIFLSYYFKSSLFYRSLWIYNFQFFSSFLFWFSCVLNANVFNFDKVWLISFSFSMILWLHVAQWRFCRSWRPLEAGTLDLLASWCFPVDQMCFQSWVQGLQCKCSSLNLLCFGKFILDMLLFQSKKVLVSASDIVILSRCWDFS